MVMFECLLFQTLPEKYFHRHLPRICSWITVGYSAVSKERGPEKYRTEGALDLFNRTKASRIR